jgi:hypothetical protein
MKVHFKAIIKAFFGQDKSSPQRASLRHGERDRRDERLGERKGRGMLKR